MPSPQASFAFQLLHVSEHGRRGRLTTAHGTIETPAFFATATAATVKAMTADAVRATGAEAAICNTYHLMLRPGAERIAELGGLHTFMDWPQPIVTDSGGFQVMSLAALRTLTEEGVTFRSHHDGTPHHLTPERAMHIQYLLDSTITLCLDECPPFSASLEGIAEAMRRSMRWAARCRESFKARAGYGLFGINQGGVFPHLRAESAHALTALGFDGYAIGGLAVGEGQARMLETLDAALPLFPEDKPRYLMGVGFPDDLRKAVQRGIDLFDCVIPTRAGRTGRAFVGENETLNLRNARFAQDPAPLEEDCPCPACRRHSRAYLHHLFRCREILGAVLLTTHNLTYYQRLMRRLRERLAPPSPLL